jgi:hypothetical protein
MNSLKKIKKYENALEVALLRIENHSQTNLTLLRKELKINKNFTTCLSKLGIIKNIGNRGTSKYLVLKKYSPELALEVLNYANEMSKNKKQTIIEKHIGIMEVEPTKVENKKSLLQRFFDIFNL